MINARNIFEQEYIYHANDWRDGVIHTSYRNEPHRCHRSTRHSPRECSCYSPVTAAGCRQSVGLYFRRTPGAHLKQDV